MRRDGRASMFPERVDASRLEGIRTLRDFDDRFTAPHNGFADAADYYAQSSSRQFLSAIRIPTLLVNAQDDPFLSDTCSPVQRAESNPNLSLEMPNFGGHVGFVLTNSDNMYWSELRARDFLIGSLD